MSHFGRAPECELRCASGEVNEIKQQNSCPFRTLYGTSQGFRERPAGRVPRREPAKPSLTLDEQIGVQNAQSVPNPVPPHSTTPTKSKHAVGRKL